MDNLFSFPSGARDAAAALQTSTSNAPSNGLSNEPNAVGEAVGTASEDVAEVPRLSEDATAVHDQLHVRLKLLDERVFDVHIGRGVSVSEFRVKVEETTAIPVDLQRLIYRGKLLKDGALLSSYEIQDGHMIHLVAKPVAVAASPASVSASVDDAASETATLDRFVGRSRERLRQTMRDEMRQHLEMPVHTPVTRQSTQRDFELLRERARIVNRMQTEENLAPATTRIRRPGTGDPTGDAWNLAVLREALGHQSDRIPRPSSGATTVRESLSQGLEQQQMAENDAPAATVAAMGLTPSTSETTATPGTTPGSEQPNLDHITQGILTLRTVLSTAALQAPAAVEPAEVASPMVAAENEDPPDQELEELVPVAVRDFTAEPASEGAETETENVVEDGTPTAFTRLNEAIALIDQSIANANRVRTEASEAARATGTHGVDGVEEARPSLGSSDAVNTPAASVSTPASIATSSLSVSPRRGRRRFFVGQWLDVKDTVNQWLECTVMDMSDEKVLVHYHGWPSRWDEWIDFDSDRIAAFRTRTQSTQFAPHLSPVPTTRLPNAPRTGENDMRVILPQLRDLMHHALPHIDRLAALCEGQVDDGEDEQRHEELSEMAHLMAPFFDRFGRVLVDSARQLDPFIRPELRQEERRRRHQQARSGNSSANRQTQTTEPPEDSAIGVRDLITPAARPPQQEAASARRSIDVHIHAIVAPSSLSSLASLARLGTAIAGAMGGGGNSTTTPTLPASNNPNELEDAFGLPRLRPIQEGSENRSILTDITEPDELDAGGRYRDTSRTPLLSAFRRNPSSRDTTNRATGGTQTQPRVRRPPSGSRLQDYLSDDFFGPSFSQDSDDMDDDDPLINGNGFNQQEEHDEVRYDEIPSPRESDSSSQGDSPSIGVIPEIEEAERRHQERLDAAQSDTDAGRASSSSSTSSTGYPTFLEVMRRTLSGVRNFGFSSSSTGETAAASPTVATQHGIHSDSEISSSSPSSSSSSSAYTPSSPSSPMTPPSSAFGTAAASESPPDATISSGFEPVQSAQPSYSFGTRASLASSSVPPTTFSTASLPGSGFSSYRSWGFESNPAFRPRQPSSVSDDDEDLDSVD